MVKKIIVTGSGGQLGQEFYALKDSFEGYEIHFFNRANLDIADREAVIELFNKINPGYCINCAAYTAVDKAEQDSDAAFNINATGAQNLAAACAKQGTKLIHFSTDYVFDGWAKTPYKEDDKKAPLGVYGSSKASGEELVVAAAPESIIIRTSWVYSVYGSNFVKTMVRLMTEKQQVIVVADQWGSPTYAADLANAVLQIIENENWVSGLYQYSNEGVINWFQFAEAIKNYLGSSCVVHPISTDQYPTPTPRPKYSAMSKEKFVATFGLTLIPWRQSLHACLGKLQDTTLSK